MLSHVTIKKLIGAKELVFIPAVAESDITRVGVHLHLAGELLVIRSGQTVDLTAIGKVSYDAVVIPEEGYLLRPGDFVLGSTIEQCQYPRSIVAVIDGRSTYARLGLTVHQTAFVIDNNYEYPGGTVLEIKNEGPCNLILKVGMFIAMYHFFELSEPVLDTANKKYHRQFGVRPAEDD